MQLVHQPRHASFPVASPSLGAGLRRALEWLGRFFRDDGGPPDYPGAVGASDLELLRLNRASTGTFDDRRRDDVVRLMTLAPGPNL